MIYMVSSWCWNRINCWPLSIVHQRFGWTWRWFSILSRFLGLSNWFWSKKFLLQETSGIFVAVIIELSDVMVFNGISVMASSMYRNTADDCHLPRNCMLWTLSPDLASFIAPDLLAECPVISSSRIQIFGPGRHHVDLWHQTETSFLIRK